MFPLKCTLVYFPVQALPEFGPYLAEKERRIAEYKKGVEPLDEGVAEVHRPPYEISKPVSSLKVTTLSTLVLHTQSTSVLCVCTHSTLVCCDSCML